MLLEHVNLDEKISKKEYNKKMEELSLEIGKAQRAVRDARKPVIIIFEGWRGVRRGKILTEIMQYMDSRGFAVHSTVMMHEADNDKPIFTYFWQNLPAKGNIAVYHRSWYYLKNSLKHKHEKDSAEASCNCISFKEINDFEKTLTDDNYLILKFFLHISPEKQKANIAKDDKKIGKLYNTSHPAINESNDYDSWLLKYDEMLMATNSYAAPWHLVSAEDLDAAKLNILTTITEKLQAFAEAEPMIPSVVRAENKYDVLSSVNPDQEMTKDEYKGKLEKYQKRLAQLQLGMHKAGISTVVALEGWDAGGKGGAIRRLTGALDPLGYRVYPVAAPNVVEREYNHLWRFWIHVPEKGYISIFDRTWYGRVMVERLEGFARVDEWERGFNEIISMEKQWTDSGIALAKFWLQISKDEQLRRFTERQNDVHKQWKITDEDWRNREKWDLYENAVNEMIARTSTPNAPWTIVEGNNKYYARLKVLKTIIDLWESKLKEKGMEI